MEAIRYEVKQGVATLTLDRPAQKNAIDETMRAEIAQVLGELKRDRAIRALVITGAGGAFCAGGDLRGIGSANLDNEGWRQRMKAAHEWLAELITLDRPVVAAVDGVAYGAGFSLALAADFVIVSPRARFCMSFLRVGLVPDFGAFYTLPRIVGVQRAKELMLSAREVGAAEAKALGIAMEIQPAERLLERAQALATSFVNASPMAVSLVKRALAAAPQADLQTLLEVEANAQALSFNTEYHRLAVARFLSKAQPLFLWPAD
jgi:2-(1,2-epoxy-1,2-dihydrophenyl)acetyl-CoA isomerase